jgi:glycosyltransferase involved in cell wall biosynthesis
MKKNVLFRSGSLRMGGLERVLIEVLQTIDKEKYNISLMIDDDCGEGNIFEKDIPREIKYYFLKSQDLIKKTEYYKEKRKNIFCKLMYNLYMNLETFIMCRESRKILKKIGEIDVLIDFDAGASKYIDKISAKKKIVWIHNSIPKLKKKKSKIERFGKRLEKYDKVVAICDEMKKELQEIYPKIKEKIIRIYNPFNFERIEKLKKDDTDLTDNDKKLLGKKYIVAIARLDSVQKDFSTLIKAFKIVKEKGMEEKLYIIGDGPSKKEIEQEIKKIGLEKEILLLGNRKNPYIWLKNSLFFVHSSKYEGLPTVLIEALICNKMIISSNCPTGPKEILNNESCGELFEVGNYHQLADLLEKYLIDKERNNKFLQEILKRKEDFNKEKIIKEYENLIDSI